MIATLFYLAVSYILQSNLELRFKRRRIRYQKVLDTYNEHKFKKDGVILSIGEYGSFIHVHVYNLGKARGLTIRHRQER